MCEDGHVTDCVCRFSDKEKPEQEDVVNGGTDAPESNDRDNNGSTVDQ